MVHLEAPGKGSTDPEVVAGHEVMMVGVGPIVWVVWLFCSRFVGNPPGRTLCSHVGVGELRRGCPQRGATQVSTAHSLVPSYGREREAPTAGRSLPGTAGEQSGRPPA